MIMRFMMELFGPLAGLVMQKTLVLLIVLVIGLTAAHGIEHRKEWVYWLALTPVTKQWMRGKKRRFIAWLPLYLATVAQAVAALGWVYLIAVYGYVA